MRYTLDHSDHGPYEPRGAQWMDGLSPEESASILNTCEICNKPFERHAASGELTCFVHGNPNGSEFERSVHRTWVYAAGFKEES